MEAHVGPLPRSVHGEIAQRDGRHAVVRVIEIAELLGGELRHAVGRDRLRQRVLPHRHRARCRRTPTSSTRTRCARACGASTASSRTCVASMLLTVYTAKSRPQLFRTPACAARWNTCVRSASSAARSASWIADSTKRNRGAPRSAARFRSFIAPRVVVREAVEPHDVGAVGNQPFGEGRSDETGHAGHERFHVEEFLDASPAAGTAGRSGRATHGRFARWPPSGCRAA